MSRYIRKMIRFKDDNEYKKSKNDEIVSNVRFYNFETRCAKYAKRRTNIRAEFDDD